MPSSPEQSAFSLLWLPFTSARDYAYKICDLISPITIPFTVIAVDTLRARAIDPYCFQENEDIEPNTKMALDMAHAVTTCVLVYLLHQRHCREAVQGIKESVHPSALIKAAIRYHAPMREIALQTSVFVIAPALLHGYILNPAIEQIPKDSRFNTPAWLVNIVFYWVYLRLMRLCYDVRLNEYYHDLIAEDLHTDKRSGVEDTALNIKLITQQGSSHRLLYEDHIPFLALKWLMNFNRWRDPTYAKHKRSRSSFSMNGDWKEQCRVVEIMLLRLSSFALLASMTNAIEYLQEIINASSVLIASLALDKSVPNLTLTPQVVTLIKMMTISFFYSYCAFEYYFSHKNIVDRRQVNWMLEHVGYHFGFGAGLALLDHGIATQQVLPVPPEVIYGFMMVLFPLLMLNTTHKLKTINNDKLDNTAHWHHRVVPLYWPFRFSRNLFYQFIPWVALQVGYMIENANAKYIAKRQKEKSLCNPMLADQKQWPVEHHDTLLAQEESSADEFHDCLTGDEPTAAELAMANQDRTHLIAYPSKTSRVMSGLYGCTFGRLLSPAPS